MMIQASDPLDFAGELQQREIEARLEAHRNRTEKTLVEKGFCYNCSEPLSTGTFCDTDCRDDYDYIQKRNKANGG